MEVMYFKQFQKTSDEKRNESDENTISTFAVETDDVSSPYYSPHMKKKLLDEEDDDENDNTASKSHNFTKINMATESHSGNPKADVENTSDTQEPDFTVPSTSSEDEDQEDIKCYNLKTPRPGLCMYIVELEFDPDDENVQLERRHASSAQFEKIKGAFERLGYFVKKKTNPTRQEALEFLQKGKEWCGKLNISLFVLIISPHGHEVLDITKEKNSAPVKPSEGIGKTRSTKEMVHQLSFHDGQTLLTKDIIKMFGRRSCHALTDIPGTFFIPACRSQNHVNYDEGVILSVNSTSENMTKERQSEKDSEDASKGDPLKDTSDAKRSIIKRSKEDEVERVRKITALYKMDQFHEYMTWFRNTNAPSLASKVDSEEVQKQKEALNCDVVKPQETEDIMALCKGYKKYTLDFVYLEHSISEPTPCANDSHVKFAYVPGTPTWSFYRSGCLTATGHENDQHTMQTTPVTINMDIPAQRKFGLYRYSIHRKPVAKSTFALCSQFLPLAGGSDLEDSHHEQQKVYGIYQRTLRTVSHCPTSVSDYIQRATDTCAEICTNNIQDDGCSYHCMRDSYKTSLVEFCAKPKFLFEYCPEYDPIGETIQKDIYTLCKPSNPLQIFYRSSDIFFCDQRNCLQLRDAGVSTSVTSLMTDTTPVSGDLNESWLSHYLLMVLFFGLAVILIVLVCILRLRGRIVAIFRKKGNPNNVQDENEQAALYETA